MSIPGSGLSLRPSRETKEASKIFVRNLPFTCTNEEVATFFSEFAPVVRAYHIMERGSKQSRGLAIVEFQMPEDVTDVVAQCKKTPPVFQERRLHIDRAVARGEKTAKINRAPKFDPAKASKARVILRNLPFHIDNTDIADFASHWGKVIDVHRPNVGEGRVAPYGFVTFDTYEAAEAAVRCSASPGGCKMMNRPIAIDHSAPKDTYVGMRSARAAEEPVVEEKPAAEEPSAESESESDSESSEYDSSGYESSSESEEAEEEPVVEEKPVAEAKPVRERRERDPNEIDRTVFIPNCPVRLSRTPMDADASRVVRDLVKDIERGMRKYGNVERVNLLRNKTSRMPIGRAFVVFENEEGAKAAVEDGRVAHMNERSQNTGNQRSVAASALAAALHGTAGAADEHGIYLEGTRLIVRAALSRKDAASASTSAAAGLTLSRQLRGLTGGTTRNLHLAMIGVILPGMPEAALVNPQDLARRTRSWNTRKSKLKNPNFVVSPTRLSIRNLPRDVDDAKLKKVSLDAVTRARRQIAEEDGTEPDSSVVRLHQVKLVQNGNYGFVEFQKHEDALHALTILNNSNVFGRSARPIVEFAIENMRELNKQRERRASDKKAGQCRAPAQANEVTKEATESFDATIKKYFDADDEEEAKLLVEMGVNGGKRRR